VHHRQPGLGCRPGFVTRPHQASPGSVVRAADGGRALRRERAGD
jgi:hypothetical protein